MLAEESLVCNAQSVLEFWADFQDCWAVKDTWDVLVDELCSPTSVQLELPLS